MHPLVKTPLHQQQRVTAEQVRDRTGIARLEELPLVEEYEPVRIRVGGEDGRLAEDVGGEDRSESGDAVVDERLWVGCLVGGDDVEGLAQEGEAEGARREAEAGGPAAAEEEEGEEGERRSEEEEVERIVHGSEVW